MDKKTYRINFSMTDGTVETVEFSVPVPSTQGGSSGGEVTVGGEVTIEECVGIVALKPNIYRYHLTLDAEPKILCEDVRLIPKGYSAIVVFYNSANKETDKDYWTTPIQSNVLKDIADDGMALADLVVGVGNDGVLITIYKADENAEKFNWYLSTVQGGETPEITVTVIEGGHRVSIDGQTFDVMNGSNGYSPVRGVDYWTETDKEEMEADNIAFITTELAKRGQLKPEFANDISECTDTTKLYVLPDGYLYGYIYTTMSGANYTNILPTLTPLSGLTKNDKGLYYGQYATSSSPFYGADTNCTITGQIPCTNASHPSIYIKGVNWDGSSSHSRILIMKNNGTAFTTVNISALATKGYFALTTLDTNYYRLDVLDALFAAEDSNNIFASLVFSLDNTTGAEDVIIAYEPIEDTEISGYQWANTGHAFVPADYENRIVALETENKQLKTDLESAEQRIETLENATESNTPQAVIDGVSALVDKALSRADGNALRFIIYSDAHHKNDDANITNGNIELGKAMGEVLNQIGVDFVSGIGDSAWAAYTNTTETVREQIKQFNRYVYPYIKGEQILNCEGNHDDAVYSTIDNDGDGTTSSAEKFSLAETFSLIYAHNKNVVFDADHYIDGYCYKDFEHLKVRVICLNTEQGTGDGGVVEGYQIKWLEEVALDMTGKTDWQVVTLAHHPFSYGTSSLNAVVEIIDAFINSGGKYIGHFHGHAHAFSVVKMQKNINGTYTDIDAWEICVPNACFSRNNQYLGNASARLSRYSTATTYNKSDEEGKRTSFNLVTVCLDEKKIYADNYGAGIDREISY